MDEKRHSNSKIIIITAAITSASILTVGVIVAVIVFFCFPYTGYEFTKMLGLKDRALFFIERYVQDDNIDGLVYCVELADELIDETDEEERAKRVDYADKLINYTEEFFSYSLVDFYFRQIDDYYLTNAPIEARVGLYSYYEYIVSCNYKARAITGENDKMIFRKAVVPLNDIFAMEPTLDELAVIYSSIYGALEINGEMLLSETGFTDFYKNIKHSLYGYAMEVENTEDTLKTLYLLRQLIRVVNGVDEFLTDRGIIDSEWRERKNNLKYRDQAISSAYVNLLSKYITKNKGE